MKMTRRSVILAPAVLARRAEAGPLAILLGEVIVGLFSEVVKVGIEYLITSVAKRSWAYMRNTPKAQFTSSYIESAQAADNYCPYCTVEFTQKGKRFWDGAMFTPNEDNQFYRSRGKATDEMLLGLLNDPDWLWHADLGRNRAAHVPTGVIDTLRANVERLQREKTRLYYQLTQNNLAPNELLGYAVRKDLLSEIDGFYRHVTATDPTHYHINSHNIEAVIMLQRYVTWFNTKLLGVETAIFRPDLLA